MDPYLGLLKLMQQWFWSCRAFKAIPWWKHYYGTQAHCWFINWGIKETQEMLDFCGEHNITSDIELIDMQDINKAYDRVTSNDVKYRFVIDMKSLK
jgi:uncharacterized zinc-type alcohol dehydrogenase-like protein